MNSPISHFDVSIGLHPLLSCAVGAAGVGAGVGAAGVGWHGHVWAAAVRRDQRPFTHRGHGRVGVGRLTAC